MVCLQDSGQTGFLHTYLMDPPPPSFAAGHVLQQRYLVCPIIKSAVPDTLDSIDSLLWRYLRTNGIFTGTQGIIGWGLAERFRGMLQGRLLACVKVNPRAYVGSDDELR